MSWQQDANCAGVSWFHDPERKRDAFALCAGCPVIAPCHRMARDDKDFEGIAAGRAWRMRKPGRPPVIKDWSHADRLTAHAQWMAGSRTEWVVEGHRAYEAYRKREQRAAKKAAA